MDRGRVVREGEHCAVKFLKQVDDWFENCGRAKRAKNDSSGTDRRTFLKGMGVAGAAVAASAIPGIPEDDVYFEGEGPGLPKEMKIQSGTTLPGGMPGMTVASFVSG